jgi:probable selenium-dependent hydroxylase accessory protein YqeC
MTPSLPFDQSAVISIVGAGGKTSLMFYLARVLKGSVITTTTTKVGYDQLQGADQLLIYDQFMGWPEQCLQAKVNWVSRALDSSQRKVDGFSPLEFRWMTVVARSQGLPIINEADGAHCRHIKAPSDARSEPGGVGCAGAANQ